MKKSERKFRKWWVKQKTTHRERNRGVRDEAVRFDSCFQIHGWKVERERGELSVCLLPSLVVFIAGKASAPPRNCSALYRFVWPAKDSLRATSEQQGTLLGAPSEHLKTTAQWERQTIHIAVLTPLLHAYCPPEIAIGRRGLWNSPTLRSADCKAGTPETVAGENIYNIVIHWWTTAKFAPLS